MAETYIWCYALRMTNGEHLLNIADVALAFAEDGDRQKENILLGLAILLDAEDILDKGRVFIGGSGREHLININKKMDELRGKIRALIDAVPPDEMRRFMDDRGEQMKRQFSLR